MTSRRPGDGLYARVEREQRWTVDHLPVGALYVAEIHDRYISGTRLRLRMTKTRTETVFKLGPKVRRDPEDPEVVKLTNIYLSGPEYEVLAALPSAELFKTRWRVSRNGISATVDEFHGHLRGLLLAEIELTLGEAHRPGWRPVKWCR